MGIKIEFNGKKYDTGIKELQVNTEYVVHIEGYNVFINVTVERPDACGQLGIFKKVIEKNIENGKSKKHTGKTGASSRRSRNGQQEKESSDNPTSQES
jgi:hypothetical protein